MNLEQRYEEVLADAARASSGISPAKLIVVTKFHGPDLVSRLIEAGCRDFGENRDQEASSKAAAVAEAHPEHSLNWHFIGQLQTNKVKSVVQYAKSIHSIDRPSLVVELGKQLQRLDKTIEGFIELNLTEDDGRGGVMQQELPKLVEQVLDTPAIKLQGLMAVAGLGEDPRSEFEKVLKAQQLLFKQVPEAKSLSIGMSEDYKIALEMGATHIRVGSKITGPRAY